MLPLPLLALVAASFGIGTTEFVIMGLLPDISRDLHVTIPAAGMLVSGYALAVALGSPVLALLLAGVSHKKALVLLMGIFTAGNLACALAPGYASLMGARVLTALSHGAFFGIGSVVAAELMPKKRAQAVAIMFTGLTLANVLGVPLGTTIGQIAGWRSPFWLIVAIGVVAMISLVVLLPAHAAEEGEELGKMVREIKALGNRQVGWAMLISTLLSVSLFATYTYIAPLLETVTRMGPKAVDWALLLFGVGLTGGNLIGGKAADWRQMHAVWIGFGSLLIVLAAFHFACHYYAPAVLNLIIWGGMVFFLVPPLQTWVMDSAKGAPNLASTLNQGAFNLGNATGAWLGGELIDAGVAYDKLPFLSMAVVVLALILCGFATRDRRRSLALSPA